MKLYGIAIFWGDRHGQKLKIHYDSSYDIYKVLNYVY